MSNEFSREHALNYARKVLRDRGIKCEQSAEDISQAAFVRWWCSRVKGRKQLDTRGATRFAVRDFFRQRRRIEAIKRRNVRSEAIRDIGLDVVALLPDEAGANRTASQVRVVLRWLSSGSTCRDVAEHLQVSPQRVSELVERVRQKFGIDYFTA